MRRTFLALVASCAALGATATRAPANVRAETTHPARIEDLLALHQLAGGGVYDYLSPSPDGRRIALFDRVMDVVGNRYIYRLIVVDVATGAARAVADAGDIILESTNGRRSGAPFDRRPVWARDGGAIFYLANVDHRAEIWRVNLATGATEPVIRGSADVRNFALTPDGGGLVFATLTPRDDITAQRAAEQRDGFRVDHAFSALYSLLPLPDETSGAAISRLVLNTGAIAPAMGEERALVALPSSHGDFIRPLDPASRVHYPELAIFASAAANAERCDAEPCHGWLDQAWLTQTADGRPQIIFIRDEGHANFVTTLYAWRPGTATVQRLHSGADRLRGCAIAGRVLLCLQDFTTQPARLVRIDLTSGALTVLFDPNPQWRAVALPRVERLDHTDAGGNESFAHVVYPLFYRPGHSYPLVLVQYQSRGFLNAGTGGETPILPLSAAGFFVLSIDRPEFRTLSRQLPFFQLARQRELDNSEDSVKREANRFFIDTLVRRGLVDPQRVAITGLSDGAETVFDTIVADPSFAAAIASNGPTDPIGYDLQAANFRAERRRDLGFVGPWDKNAGEWRQWWAHNTPALHADVIRTPLMLNLPESDALLAFPLITRLEATPTPVETYIYPGAYHLKWRPSQVLAVQRRTLDWLRFWLEGAPPANATTAARWRDMRTRMHTQSGAAGGSASSPRDDAAARAPS